jgi:hypothetical protein
MLSGKIASSFFSNKFMGMMTDLGHSQFNRARQEIVLMHPYDI